MARDRYYADIPYRRHADNRAVEYRRHTAGPPRILTDRVCIYIGEGKVVSRDMRIARLISGNAKRTIVRVDKVSSRYVSGRDSRSEC